MSNPETKKSVVSDSASLWLTTDIAYYSREMDVNAASIRCDFNAPNIAYGTVSGLSDESLYDVRMFDISDIEYFKGVASISGGTWAVEADVPTSLPRIFKVYDTENDEIVAVSTSEGAGAVYSSVSGIGSKFAKIYDANGTLLTEGYSGVGLLRSFILSQEDPAFAALGYRSFLYDQAIGVISACNMNDQNKAEFWAQGLMRGQQVADSWYPFGVNTQSAQMLDPYYRMGAGMWCAYALLWFAQKYPASSFADLAKTAAKNFLDMALSKYMIYDPARIQYGSFTLGQGRYNISDSYTLNVGANATLGNIGGDQEHCGVWYETSGQGTCSIVAAPWAFETISTTYQKMGIMLRDENGDPTAYSNRGRPYVFVGVLPSDAVTASWVFSYRTVKFKGAVESTGALPAQPTPYPSFTPASALLRLDKRGDTFTAYVKTDRSLDWTAVGACTFTLSADGTYHKMLAASSGDAGVPAAVRMGELSGFDTVPLTSNGNLGNPDPTSSFAYFEQPNYGCAYLFDPAYKPQASSTEHNLDSYFALNLAGTVLADGTYCVHATRVMNFLTNYIWVGDGSGRCRQGYSDADGPDDYLALDCHTWLAMAFADAGRLDLAVPALMYADRFLNTEYVVDTGGTASGYTAYIYPDQSKSEGIWVEGTYGAVLAMVACGSRARAIQMFEAMKPLKESEGFPTKTRVDHVADQQLWTALGGTGWGVLAAKSDGFWGVAGSIVQPGY